MPIPDLPDPPDPPDPPPPSTPRDDEGRSIPGDVPDLRRDALEEAAETSTEALDRTRRLDELEAAADPAFALPPRPAEPGRGGP